MERLYNHCITATDDTAILGNLRSSIWKTFYVHWNSLMTKWELHITSIKNCLVIFNLCYEYLKTRCRNPLCGVVEYKSFRNPCYMEATWISGMLVSYHNTLHGVTQPRRPRIQTSPAWKPHISHQYGELWSKFEDRTVVFKVIDISYLEQCNSYKEAILWTAET
jgi:hypothetical protein